MESGRGFVTVEQRFPVTLSGFSCSRTNPFLWLYGFFLVVKRSPFHDFTGSFL
ncbi:hypothetical protein JCM10003_2550 [Bacteroides pyogenes JCM 10003]|nr:hypothetical protein JCM10003_2550 [Bacteroides pyogenes JCM 10003]